MNDALVSVIIPVYNVEKYLDECVQSVLQQRYEQLDIILVDDGSCDASAAMCDAYALKDDRVRVIHQENKGLSGARNAGLLAAKGKYVYFLDSDDVLVRDAIDLLVSYSKMQKTNFLFFDACVFYDGCAQDAFPKEYYVRRVSYPVNDHSACVMQCLLENKEYRSAVPLLFMERACLENYKLTFQEGLLYEDELFTAQLFLADVRTAHLGLALYKRRVRANSIMTSAVSLKNFTDVVKIVRSLMDLYDHSEDAWVKKACFRNILRLTMNCTIKYASLTKQEQDAAAKEGLLLVEDVVSRETVAKGLYQKLRRPYLPPPGAMRKVLGGIKRRTKKIFSAQTKAQDSLQYPLDQANLQKKPRIFLLGTPMHGNLGDHAIAMAERCFFLEHCDAYGFVEILMPDLRDHFTAFMKLVQKDDVLVISGGGWLGDLWLHNEEMVRKIIQSFPENTIVILPQTIYYKQDEQSEREIASSRAIYNAHPALYLCLRDERSFAFAKEKLMDLHSQRVFLLPDMALYLKRAEEKKRTQTCLLCLRKDREKVLEDEDAIRLYTYLLQKEYALEETTTVYLHTIPYAQRKASVEQKLDEYGRARFVITDRLHSMIFCWLTKTPCIAFDNLTKKVGGVYEKWMQGFKGIHVVHTLDECIDLLENGLDGDREENEKEEREMQNAFAGLQDLFCNRIGKRKE